MRGGLKRKRPIAKIENEASRGVTFSKRIKGLHSKASELCLLSDSDSDTQIAIISTPISSNSNAAFYSFGHPSVDSVVTAFLTDQRPLPPEDQKLRFWWEDKELAESEDPEELRNALDPMMEMLHDLRMAVAKRGDREDVKEKKKKKDKNVLHGAHQNQTLNLQASSSASLCNQEENFEGFNKNIEEQQVLAICDKSSNDEVGNLDGFGDYHPFYDSEAVKGGELVVHRNFNENNLHFPELDGDQFVATLPGNLGESNQELHLDELIEVDTNFESFWMNFGKMDGDAVEVGR